MVTAVLEPALRNYLLSNSQKTFERSYQPRHISFDLMQATFSDAGSTPGTQRLYEILGQACMAHDEKTPISLTQKELRELDSHSYVVSFRKEYEKANAELGRDNVATRRAQVAMRTKRQQLEERMIREKRDRYFDKADRLRALGESVEEAFPDARDHTRPRSISHTAKAQLAIRGTTSISEFMHRDDLCDDARQQKFVDMVFEFLAHRPANTDYIFRDIVDEADDKASRPVEPVFTLKNSYRCLFGCPAMSKHVYLTGHTETYHKPSFETPFYCPECRRRRLPPVIIENLEHWCVHAERAHGKMNAPSNRPHLKDGLIKRYEKPPKAPCLFCRAKFCVGQGYARHFNKHAEKEFRNTKGFDCPKCRYEGKGSVRILERESWLLHAREVHHIDAVRGTAPDEILEKKVALPKRRERKQTVRRKSTEVSGSPPKSITTNPEVRKTEGEAISNSGTDIDLMDCITSDIKVYCGPGLGQKLLEFPPQLIPNGYDVETINDAGDKSLADVDSALSCNTYSDNRQPDLQGVLDLQGQADFFPYQPGSPQLELGSPSNWLQLEQDVSMEPELPGSPSNWLQLEQDVSMELELPQSESASPQLETYFPYQPDLQQHTVSPTPVPFQIESSIPENISLVPTLNNKDETQGSYVLDVRLNDQHILASELEFNPW